MKKNKEILVGDDDLTVNVLNFPNTFFYLKLERTKSFKHKQDEIVNEQSYIEGLKENVIVRNVTLGDIHNQLYLLFHSLLEEIHNARSFCLHLGGGWFLLFLFAIVPEVSISLVMH